MTSSGTTDAREMVGVMGASESGSSGEDRLGQAASGVADRVTGTLSEQANTRTDDQLTKAGDMLDQVAGAVRKSGDQLRSDQPQVAGFADTAAGEVEKAARFLREADLDMILQETESFARRQPAVFIGAALALGFAASRFLKASPGSARGRAYQDHRSSYGHPSDYGYGRGSGAQDGGYAYGGYPTTSYDTRAGLAAGTSAGTSSMGSRTTQPLSDASAGERGYERS